MAASKLRGEADIVLGEESFRLRATMDDLDRLSSSVGAMTLQDLYTRLVGSEITAIRAGLLIMAKEGKDDKGDPIKKSQVGQRARDAYMLSDAAEVRDAFLKIFAVFVRDSAVERDTDGEDDDSGNA